MGACCSKKDKGDDKETILENGVVEQAVKPIDLIKTQESPEELAFKAELININSDNPVIGVRVSQHKVLENI